MYIIEFNERWVKKDGKLSFCKVMKDKESEDEVSELLHQYIKDLCNLINSKLTSLKQSHKVPEGEIKKIRDLIKELRHATDIDKKIS